MSDLPQECKDRIHLLYASAKEVKITLSLQTLCRYLTQNNSLLRDSNVGKSHLLKTEVMELWGCRGNMSFLLSWAGIAVFLVINSSLSIKSAISPSCRT